MTAEQTVALKLRLANEEWKSAATESSNALRDLKGDVTDTGAQIERSLAGAGDSAGRASSDIRALGDRLAGLTGADRDILIRAEISNAESEIRKVERMLADPTLNDHDIRILIDQRNEASRSIQELKGELGQLEDAADAVGDEMGDVAGKLGSAAGSIAGVLAGGAIVGTLDDAAVSAGKLRAQLGLTVAESESFDVIAKQVYRDNFADSMVHASQVTGLVHQSLGLVDDELLTATESIFALEDAFGHVGADVQIITEDVRTLRANFPGLTEQRALDLIARGFQDGTGRAGDLQDTLQEYPGDFARMGLNADDMFGILNAGLEAGVRNTDVMADAVREMGIRISTAGDTGQEALAKLFPQAEAERLIADVTAGGEAGRDAFYTILDGLTAVTDPQERYNLAVEIMGTKGEELANQLPAMRDALLEVRDGTIDADGAAASLNEQYTGMGNDLESLKRTIQTSLIGPLGDAGGVALETATGVGTLALGMQGLGLDVKGLGGKLGGLKGILAGGVGLAGLGLLLGGVITQAQEAGAMIDNMTEAMLRGEDVANQLAIQALSSELKPALDAAGITAGEFEAALNGDEDALRKVHEIGGIAGTLIDELVDRHARAAEQAGLQAELEAELAGEVGAVADETDRLNQRLGETPDALEVRFGVSGLEELARATSLLQEINRLGNVNVRAELSGGQIHPRAGGGETWPGGTFLVGEEGPELLRMGPSGYGVVVDATTTRNVMAFGDDQATRELSRIRRLLADGIGPSVLHADLGEGITARIELHDSLLAHDLGAT